MKDIKLEFDYLIGPIVKDVFDQKQNKLITGISAIDNDNTLNELNEKACMLYSSFFVFDDNKTCSFDKELAEKHANELHELLNSLLDRLNLLNDGTFTIQDLATEQLKNIVN